MKNYLAIDYGKNNIGIAYKIGDNPIVPGDIVFNHSDQSSIDKIKQLCSEKNITQIVIGMPYTLRREIGPQAIIVNQFIDLLKASIALPITTIDERFTSSIFDSKLPNLDSYAAVEILNSHIKREIL